MPRLFDLKELMVCYIVCVVGDNIFPPRVELAHLLRKKHHVCYPTCSPSFILVSTHCLHHIPFHTLTFLPSTPRLPLRLPSPLASYLLGVFSPRQEISHEKNLGGGSGEAADRQLPSTKLPLASISSQVMSGYLLLLLLLLLLISSFLYCLLVPLGVMFQPSFSIDSFQFPGMSDDDPSSFFQ